MKPGRLKSSTLTTILKSVGLSDDGSTYGTLPPSCKYYIPTTSNNPLYGALSLNPTLAVASAAMAVAIPQDELMDSPSVGSAVSSPVNALSPETNIAIQAVSATSRNLRARGTRWASFVDNRMETPSTNVYSHRRTRSWPNQHNMASNLQQVPEFLSPTIPEEPSVQAIPPPLTSRNSTPSIPLSRLSFSEESPVTNSSGSASGSLDTITIPLLPPNSNSGSAFPKENNKFKEDPELNWLKDYEHINIDWSMRGMDTIYSASFYTYIRDEKNVDFSSVRLSRIIKDYKPRQVALSLRWLTQGWSVENTSRMMRNVFLDWLPDLAGCVFALVSKNWPVRPQMSLCMAYLLINEPPAVCAVFLRTVTCAWKRDDAIELISYLDGLLEWDEAYFHELMSVYAEKSREDSLKELSKKGASASNGRHYQDQVLQYLSKLSEKHSAAAANGNDTNTDGKAGNEINLALISHYINCKECQNHETCEIARMLVASTSTASGLDAQEPSFQTINPQTEVSSSEPQLSVMPSRQTGSAADVSHLTRIASEKGMNTSMDKADMRPNLSQPPSNQPNSGLDKNISRASTASSASAGQ